MILRKFILQYYFFTEVSSITWIEHSTTLFFKFNKNNCIFWIYIFYVSRNTVERICLIQYKQCCMFSTGKKLEELYSEVHVGHYFSTAPTFYVTFFDCLHIFRICLPTWSKFTPWSTDVCYHPFPNCRGWNFHP